MYTASRKVFVLFMPIGPDFEGAFLFHINIKPLTILIIGNESTSILKVFDNEKLLESVLGRE